MPDRNIRQDGRLRYWPRPLSQIGNRGKMLIVFGLAWVILGLGIPAETFSGLRIEVAYHLGIPATLRAWIWCASGASAIFVAFRPKGVSDALGWVALYLPPGLRFTSYLIAWIDSLVPVGADGFAQGWVTAALYGALVYIIYVLSGWPEPPLRAVYLHETDEAANRNTKDQV